MWDNIPKVILKLFSGATMNNFQIDMAFKNNKKWCVILKGNIYFKGNEKFTINGLHGVIDFISWTTALYCITLWLLGRVTN
jgi:hypothetical protein